MIVLSAYSHVIEFRHTHEHSNADGLSRLPVNCVNAIGHCSEPALFNFSQLQSLPVTASQIAKGLVEWLRENIFTEWTKAPNLVQRVVVSC